MVDRSSHRVGRLIAVACAVVLGAAGVAAAQTAALPSAPNPSRVDVFLGYSYFGAHGSVKPQNINYSSIDVGAIGSVTYYFNRYIGAQVEFAAHPDGRNDGLYTAMAGPIARLPLQNYTLFVHALAGADKLGGPNVTGGIGNPYTFGPAMVVGGGMDYDLPFFNHHLGFRLFQADYEYIHTDFGPPYSNGQVGGRANLNSARLSSGILLKFGSVVPPPPVTYACVASPAAVYPGDPVTVTGTATNLNPKKTVTYTWVADSAKVTGTSNVGAVDTTTLAPGTYTVKGHVAEGTKPGQFADCAATFTVNPIQPPTISCSANPSSVNPSDSSTITATAVSPQNRPLTYSYSASAGSISGSTSTATLSTAGAAPGSIVVTCNVVDDKANAVSSTTQVTVIAPPAPPAPTTSSLCSISFEKDKKRPTRVDNEAKACLDDISLSLQHSTDAKVALVGSSSPKEKKGEKFAAERAVNAKSYLVTEKGIDSSRVQPYTDGTDGKTVASTLIPAGATFNATGVTPVDESATKAKPRKAAPAHHHKKAATEAK